MKKKNPSNKAEGGGGKKMLYILSGERTLSDPAA